jgi:predicted nucleic acid-binding protein
MPGGVVDTNVLVYAFTTDRWAATAQDILERGCTTSVQGLDAFANVARRKLGMTWEEVRDALGAICILCRRVLPLDIETHVDALRIAERYRYTMFDSLIVASALRVGSDTLWSEDLQDGAVIDRRLRIANPFRDV